LQGFGEARVGLYGEDKRLNTRGTLKNVISGGLYFWHTFRRRHPSEETERTVDALQGVTVGKPPRSQAYLSFAVVGSWPVPFNGGQSTPKEKVEATPVIARRPCGQEPLEYANSNDKAKPTVCIPTPVITRRRQSTNTLTPSSQLIPVQAQP
jgi:hypothetical protein